jgi:NAD kinase
MDRLTENKIVLITRKTRIDELIVRFNTLGQARFYVEHLGADFTDYMDEHENYYNSLDQVKVELERLGRLQVTDRAYLPNFLFGPEDTIVVLGQDGLVANTVKYSQGLPILGVNPDPERWDGVLVPFEADDLHDAIMELFNGGMERKRVTMAAASLNDGQRLLAVNDFFIGVRSHTSARYIIGARGERERHSSSGVIVSTGLGSTGWYKSLLTGALAIASQGHEQAQPRQSVSFPWDSEFLRFTVREPFPSKTSSATLVHGEITRDNPLELTSLTAEGGVIFSDGIEKDFLDFNSGTRVEIAVADRYGQLVV